MKLYEKFTYDEKGYRTLFQYKDWRVAILNYVDSLRVDQIDYVEAHHETDEIFVLLEGSCYMFLKGKDGIEFELLALEKNHIYNIPANIYHTHVLSEDAKVLLVEQRDTSDENSTRIYLSPEERKQIKEKLEKFYGTL